MREIAASILPSIQNNNMKLDRLVTLCHKFSQVRRLLSPTINCGYISLQILMGFKSSANKRC